MLLATVFKGLFVLRSPQVSQLVHDTAAAAQRSVSLDAPEVTISASSHFCHSLKGLCLI